MIGAHNALRTLAAAPILRLWLGGGGGTVCFAHRGRKPRVRLNLFVPMNFDQLA